MPILIQVNIGEESSKAGVFPEALHAFLNAIPKSLWIDIQGLMTIPPYQPDPEKSRPYFKKMKALLEESKSTLPYYPLSELSMGMSNDFKVAIEEGATQIRIGRGIFGPRQRN